MSKFTFGRQLLSLDIADQQFIINPRGEQVYTCMLELKNACREMKDAMQGRDPDMSFLASIGDVINPLIDRILGNGACDKIFAGRGKSYIDTLEVALFIVEEIGSGNGLAT